MNKVILQFLVLVAIFLATWFLLSHVNFMKLFHVDQLGAAAERKIGEAVIQDIRRDSHEITNDSLVKIVDHIKDALCTPNGIDKDSIHVFLMESSVLNAFSLPGNNMIINTALVRNCDSIEDLEAVMAHEMAHMQLHHIMKKLSSQVGLTMLAAIASGGNAQGLGQVVRLLSSSAFERKLESAADAQGIIYLKKADINPRALPDMLEKLDDASGGFPNQLAWIASHPDTQSRLEALRRKIGRDSLMEGKQVISDSEWGYLEDACHDN